MNSSCKLFLPVFFLVLMVSSCMKDTDFEQADNIVLTPVVELNLIYFNLPASRFFDTLSSTPVFTVRDTTEIDFLDDSGVQESLRRVEFYFKFNNSIPRTFNVDFQFLSLENDTTYVTETSVNSGTELNPVVTEFIESVEGDEIINLTQASKVVVSVTIPSADESLEGELQLRSKATYFLEVQ